MPDYAKDYNIFNFHSSNQGFIYQFFVTLSSIMKVLKFGGTSVGTAESLQQVKNIVCSQSQPVVVVVSALGGVTDRLITTARMAADGNSGYEDLYNDIAGRHLKMISDLFSNG